MAKCKLTVLFQRLGEDPRRKGEGLLRGTVPGICAVFGQNVREVWDQAAQRARVVVKARKSRGLPINPIRTIPAGTGSTTAEIEVDI